MQGTASPMNPAARPASWPVHDISTSDTAEEGIALCLSGGGYRAMLFHTGALWRLNEAGFLPQLERVSSVSGGSIAAGVLGSRWSELGFDAAGVATNFRALVVQPIRALASVTIDIGSVLKGIMLPGDIASRVVTELRSRLFGDRTLQDLPAGRPRFVINATSLQSGVLWRFSRPYAWDYRVGKIPEPRILLARAVAASAAFPPLLSPVRLDLRDVEFEPQTGEDLQQPPYTDRAVLADGGVYDNLGLETAFKRYRTILVSDGGGQSKPDADPPGDWPRQMLRVLRIIDSQVRSLRKRQLIDAYETGLRRGAYWGIGTDIANYQGVEAPLPCPHAATMRLAHMATRLAALKPVIQEQLVNWGYGVCDAALRCHVDDSIPQPSAFPYPTAGVGARESAAVGLAT